MISSQIGFNLVGVEAAVQVEHGDGDQGAKYRSMVHLLQVKALFEAHFSRSVLALGGDQLHVLKVLCPAEGERFIQKGSADTSLPKKLIQFTNINIFLHEKNVFKLYLYLVRTLNLRIQAIESGCCRLLTTAMVPTILRLQWPRSRPQLRRPASETTANLPVAGTTEEKRGS